jgi:hypothetical protein
MVRSFVRSVGFKIGFCLNQILFPFFIISPYGPYRVSLVCLYSLCVPYGVAMGRAERAVRAER